MPDLIVLVIVDGQAVAFVVADVVDVPAIAEDAPGARQVGAGDQFEQRGLAGAVRSHDADHRGLRNAEVGLQPEGLARAQQAAPVRLAQALDAQDRLAHGQIPSRRCRRPESARSSDAWPAWITRPWSMTYTRSATSSALTAFCSTTSTAMPSARSRRIVAITSCTTFGASPWEGSSSSTRPGEPSRAREIATICISPPDRFSLSRGMRCSDRKSTRLNSSH